MKTRIGDIFIHLGDEERARAEEFRSRSVIEVGCAWIYLPSGSTLVDAQAVADAINAAIEGAKARADAMLLMNAAEGGSGQ